MRMLKTSKVQKLNKRLNHEWNNELNDKLNNKLSNELSKELSEKLSEELIKELSEELSEEKKKICSAIEFVNKTISKKTLSKVKKAHYLSVLYFFWLLLKGQKKMKAVKAVTDMVDSDFRNRFLSKSFLHDELAFIQLMTYLCSQKFKVDPVMVKTYFEQNILPQLNIKLVDPKCKIRTFPDLDNGKKEHIWVTHNETTFYIYDGPHSMWGPEKEQPLRKKGLGSAMHVSNFLTKTIGPLKDEQEEAHVMMVLGANWNSYWDSKKLLEQVVQAVKIFKRMHLECVSMFVFDNATSHKAFAEDALVASKMNLGLGRSVLKIQDTMWSGSHQSIIIEEDHFIYNKKKTY
ncbi:17121_t:CDS:2 [Cetraspora pellucida]|uniref:17121_t:CDS:1 n=1 Tax=Cetraspora pellucida TaxID=1433469 RepID=A0A9N9E2V5_9GLOM|nr:17121_t:CDS:2 [Cetraspora pellucida]